MNAISRRAVLAGLGAASVVPALPRATAASVDPISTAVAAGYRQVFMSSFGMRAGTEVTLVNLGGNLLTVVGENSHHILANGEKISVRWGRLQLDEMI